MHTLSPLDASFLYLESPSLHMHIASVGIYEGPPPRPGELEAAIAAKLPLVPSYREKVRFVPGGLGAPVWVDDPHFDLAYHVRHTGLPAPGGEAELNTAVGRVLGLALDRERPLWELWAVSGLQDGRWALVAKTHHCLVDGVASSDLLSVLLDHERRRVPADVPEWHPAPEPDGVYLLAEAVGGWAGASRDAVRALAAAMRSPRRTLAEWRDDARGLAAMEPLVRQGHGTSLNHAVGAHRRWAGVRGTLADVKTVRGAFGGTLNDVVLAAITNGFRELLLSRGEAVEEVLLRTLVPVSVRAPGEHGLCDNRVSAIYAELPVGLADPVERLRAITGQMRHLKESGQAVGGRTLVALGDLVPPGALALGTRVVAALPQRTLQTVTTNVPGPRQTLYLAGRRLEEIFPMVPLGPAMSLGVAILTYEQSVNFGITGDYDTTADIDVLARGIEAGMAALVRAARES